MASSLINPEMSLKTFVFFIKFDIYVDASNPTANDTTKI